MSLIIRSAKNLASRVPDQEELIRTLEGFRLTMILRQLQISSFNGKMNALNEINKVISSVTYYSNRHHGVEEDEYLTPERMAVSMKYFQCSINIVIVKVISYRLEILKCVRTAHTFYRKKVFCSRISHLLISRFFI